MNDLFDRHITNRVEWWLSWPNLSVDLLWPVETSLVWPLIPQESTNWCKTSKSSHSFKMKFYLIFFVTYLVFRLIQNRFQTQTYLTLWFPVPVSFKSVIHRIQWFSSWMCRSSLLMGIYSSNQSILRSKRDRMW